MNRWRWWLSKRKVSDAARSDQLQSVAVLALRIRDVFHSNGEEYFARGFIDLACDAAALLEKGFDQQALNKLSATMPGSPSWLDSRSVDYNGPREPWQELLVADYWACWYAVLELRVIGQR